MAALRNMKVESMRARLGGTEVLFWVTVVLGIALRSLPASALEIGKPIFDPDSKSYFTVFDDNTKGPWEEARALAASKIYKGIRGRLAIIRNPRTHAFLRRNFDIPSWTWIGLRYWCKFRKLQWVTGDIIKTGQFSPWAAQWYRVYDTSCGRGTATRDDSYMPVYYSPAGSDRGFTWQASGPAKGFIYYFVEYPAAQKQQ